MNRTIRIKENSFFAKMAAQKMNSGAVAMVLGHTIHLHGVSKKNFLADNKWLRHELKHVEQYERYGFFLFIVKYLWQTLKHGYYNSPMEKEAREAENDGTIEGKFKHQII